MAASSKKRQSFIQQHSALFVTLVSALGISVLFLGLAKLFVMDNNRPAATPLSKSKLAYVDGSAATDQVTNFYKQYIDARSTSAFQTKLLEAYGDKNLSFYNQYYLHGFDPIVCSTVMPYKVTTSLVSTGSVAHVNAIENFSDGTQQTIKATVVLNDKLAIDSITCPGAKGNLPPASYL